LEAQTSPSSFDEIPDGNSGKKPGEIQLETHILRESSRRRKYRTKSREVD
jgi:hypothetical protein